MIPSDMTAQEAVDDCRLEWSKFTAQIALGGCDYDWTKPQSVLELAQDYLCERGPSVVTFNWDDQLTRELAQTYQIALVRNKFYRTGDINFNDLQEFNEPDVGLATLDMIYYGRSISHFLGSINVRVTKSNGRVQFFVYNRTDLASASHIKNRFESGGYDMSVEELLELDPGLGSRPLAEVVNDPSNQVISILKRRKRGETEGWGGGTMHQIFNWSERKIDCLGISDYLYYFFTKEIYLDMGEYNLPYPSEVINELEK
jgi:hypothetical protein